MEIYWCAYETNAVLWHLLAGVTNHQPAPQHSRLLTCIKAISLVIRDTSWYIPGYYQAISWYIPGHKATEMYIRFDLTDQVVYFVLRTKATIVAFMAKELNLSKCTNGIFKLHQNLFVCCVQLANMVCIRVLIIQTLIK